MYEHLLANGDEEPQQKDEDENVERKEPPRRQKKERKPRRRKADAADLDRQDVRDLQAAVNAMGRAAPAPAPAPAFVFALPPAVAPPAQDAGGVGIPGQAFAQQVFPVRLPADAPAVIGRRGNRLNHLRGFGSRDRAITPADGVEWLLADHNPAFTRTLTADDPRADDPAGFKGRLYAPQATLLHAMLRLEGQPVLKLSGDGRKPVLQTNRGLISEDFGFGKTVAVLSLVCASRRPRPIPTNINVPLMVGAQGANKAMVALGSSVAGKSCRFNPDGEGYLPELTCRYDRILPVTLVYAANAVISQWVDNTKQFTDLKYFVVENVHTLREFEKLFRSGEIATYDLIFVKVGKVTTSFQVKGEPKTEAKARPLLQALSAILDGVALARMVVDDFDTIKLSTDDYFIPALFTWLITATRRATMVRIDDHIEMKDGKVGPLEFLRSCIGKFPILGAALDDIVYGPLSLHCDSSYVKDHITTTTISARRVFVRGGRVAAVLRDLGVADDVVEMVNADAIATAAENLGINAKNARDLIDRILTDRKGKYKQAITVLERVDRTREILCDREGKEGDGEKIKALRAALKSGTDTEVENALGEVEGMSTGLSASLKSLEEWALEEKEKFGKALQRMRDNVREQKCQCCMIPLTPDDGGDGEDAFILNCCQIVVCEPCIAVGSGAYGGGGSRVFISKCPSCASSIKASRDFIRVGKELSLEDALSDDVLKASGDAQEKSVLEKKGEQGEHRDQTDGEADGETENKKKDPLDELNNPKLKALIQLVRGDVEIDCIRQEDAPLDSKGLLAGKRNAPWPEGKQKKYLVGAMHPESTHNISEAFSKFGLKHVVLRGNRAQKDACKAEFMGETHIMIITAVKDCAGLHLPFVAWGIEYHYITDPAVRAQFRGRYHRPGREHSSVCLTLVNEAEADQLR